jgi:hypothetical protein
MGRHRRDEVPAAVDRSHRHGSPYRRGASRVHETRGAARALPAGPPRPLEACVTVRRRGPSSTTSSSGDSRSTFTRRTTSAQPGCSAGRTRCRAEALARLRPRRRSRRRSPATVTSRPLCWTPAHASSAATARAPAPRRTSGIQRAAAPSLVTGCNKHGRRIREYRLIVSGFENDGACSRSRLLEDPGPRRSP